MKNLNDYGGALLSDLTLGDFSRDTLERLVLLYTKLYMILDTFRYFTVLTRQNDKEAWDSELQTWTEMSKYEMKRIKETVGIQGNGLMALMKAMQMAPWFLHTAYKIDVENKNSMLLTVTDCPTLNALKKEGQGRQKDVCSILGLKLFEDYASVFSPDIEVKCLTPLPMCNYNDIPCKRSLKLTK